MMRTSLAFLSLLPLAACDMHSNPATKDGHDVHISVGTNDSGGGQVALNVPGLDGKFSIPAFFMKNGHMDIDGLKLAPDTTIRTVDIVGKDNDKDDKGKDQDNVHLTFSNPKAPAELTAYYKQAAENAGFTIAAAGDGLIATKGKKVVKVSLTGDGAGSRGAIDVNEQG